eukprot:7311770-Prorocentrum_lima.AAC.1
MELQVRLQVSNTVQGQIAQPCLVVWVDMHFFMMSCSSGAKVPVTRRICLITDVTAELHHSSNGCCREH